MWFGLGGFLLVVGVTLEWLVAVHLPWNSRIVVGALLMALGVVAIMTGVVLPRWRARHAQSGRLSAS